MKPSHILLVLAGSALSLSAQKTFSGPAGAYIFDGAAHSVRPVLGVPGAAYLGSSSQPAWDSVFVAPNGQWGLGVSNLSLSWIPDLSQPASFTSIAPAPEPISRIVWSSDSTTAAIWSPAAGQLRRITGLGSTPAVHDPVDLSAVGGRMSGWNLSADGRYLALSRSAPETSSVYLSDQDATPVPIYSLDEAGAVAFSADGSSLYVFSGAKHQIMMLTLPSGAVAGSFDASPFAAARGTDLAGGGIQQFRPGRRVASSGVQDLAVSPDGARLYAVGGQTLCGYDIPTEQILPCSALDITPASFQTMPGGILLLNYPRSGSMPIWLLDAKAGQIYFVPAGSLSADASF